MTGSLVPLFLLEDEFQLSPFWHRFQQEISCLGKADESLIGSGRKGFDGENEGAEAYKQQLRTDALYWYYINDRPVAAAKQAS